ncbi:MAG: cytochrome c oxidase subunit II [Cyanobacteria bacterium J06635_11]
MNRKQILRLVALAAANLAISLWMGQQAYTWMPPQASAEAVLVDRLFSFMTTIGTFIFLGVVGTLLYSMVYQRAAKYDDTDGPPIEGNITLEVVWTAIPILLVIWIGAVSFQTYDKMSILGDISLKEMAVSEMAASAMAAPKEMAAGETLSLDSQKTVATGVEVARDTPPIEVRSRQWAWEFRYPQANITSTELHLPVNQRARFKLISEDVLHGFYVPAFRVKQDIIPGKEIDFSFTPIREGRYRLRDSEYSGTYFAANQTNVVVESADAYQQWLSVAALASPVAAENVAYEEFNRATEEGSTGEGSVNLGWATVKPAPAPVVNYTSSEKDSHE